MKKIIAVSILFAFVFCFSGCSEKNPEISQEILFFENTEWGMTKAETMKALNLKEEDLVKKPPFGNDYLDIFDIFEVKDYKYKNKKCDMSLSFSNNKTKTIEADRLCNVDIYSDNKAFIQDELDTYKSMFDGMQTITPVDEAAEEISVSAYWESTKSAKDYAIENNVLLQDYIKCISPIPDDSRTFTDEEVLEILDGDFPKLSKLAINVNEKPNARGYVGSIAFFGVPYAEISAFKK